MNLRDLNYFVVLAELRHFGEAAKRCYISQPTLSMQIKKLEETLGVALFERSNKQVFLTDEGYELLSKAKKILILCEEMKAIAQHSQDPYAGDLHLGVIPTVAPYLLPAVMPTIKNTFPNLKIWLVEEQTHRLISKLEGGEIDAAIMAQPVASNFAHHHLFKEAFYFTCAHNHPLAQSRHIAISDLANQQVMLLAEGHCLRDQAMAVCQMAKANEVADFTATSLETLRLMVQAGMGVTLLPALAVGTESSDLLKCIPFEEPVPTRTLALFWRSGTPKNKCLRALADLIIQLITPKLKSILS
ncbi:LysR substrate-binding domain-containing protein [Legionella maioricensis]|uniref:LysR substrate-binding domain-containing protein n=1 Tax=Legionella maioricensis TaxID=2896528 RepID=A0A9X2IB77_9GAMM|nr:LysR substrate-binding domain-containing protein [Legionella maioricensis]MCL9682523.1 LysR substrate-binding domain-containing protein [Legionella maioricensis]MCL9686230.1 LysR substrate-binding domain-containing protein [Legionella maioricensis]